MNQNDKLWMLRSLNLARQAELLGEIPIGAMVVCNNKLVGSGYNKKEYDNNPIAHAEILAIQKAAKKLNRWRLDDCVLYVTLEPCQMCLTALDSVRLKRIICGANSAKNTKTRLNYELKKKNTIFGGFASFLLSNFFKNIRILNLKNNKSSKY